jgi:hypothetical protein
VRSDRYFYGLQAAFLQCQLEILAIKTPVTAPLFLVQLAEKMTLTSATTELASVGAGVFVARVQS